MKNIWRILLLIPILLTACNPKMDTIEKAISEHLENVERVYVVEKMDKGSMIIYGASKVDPNLDEVTVIGFFKGNHKESWELLKGVGGWTYYKPKT
jgi:hypothetical protein